MKRSKLRYLIPFEVLCLVILAALCLRDNSFRERFLDNLPFFHHTAAPTPAPPTEEDGPYPTLPQYSVEESYETTSDGKNFIKWVDFNVTCEALEDTYEQDVATYGQDIHLNWIELLALLATGNGGNFSNYKKSDLTKLVTPLLSGETTIEELASEQKYYSYYYEAYSAVLGGMVGEYEIETAKEGEGGGSVWEKKYGLKSYLPIAKNFPYSDYDDFGASRSYGYKRLHLGHDMLGQVGTPIIAVESGYVEALGWNEFGGWRIGIRSFDNKRYYYYAHLRKNFPYNKSLTVGSVVTAGDVIGYLGRTGYSKTENTNNIETAHLHFGLQLIFDESQKECDSEIWIDCYELILFLYRNRSETEKNQETKEWYRIFDMHDPAVEEYKEKTNTDTQETLQILVAEQQEL